VRVAGSNPAGPTNIYGRGRGSLGGNGYATLHCEYRGESFPRTETDGPLRGARLLLLRKSDGDGHRVRIVWPKPAHGALVLSWDRYRLYQTLGYVPRGLALKLDRNSTALDDIPKSVPSDDDADGQAVMNDLRRDISEMLKSLSETERRVVELRYGLNGETPSTLARTGKILGKDRERIRGIEMCALRRIREHARADELVGYLRPHSRAQRKEKTGDWQPSPEFERWRADAAAEVRRDARQAAQQQKMREMKVASLMRRRAALVAKETRISRGRVPAGPVFM
jgi:hypothetical protein